MGHTDGVSDRVVVIDPDPSVLTDLEAALDASVREFQVIAASGPRELPDWWVERADCFLCEFDLPDGSGTDSDLRETVMESGYTTAESGNGLGLAIVRRLAEAQGWSVSIVESDEGGTRFEFRPTEAAVVASADD